MTEIACELAEQIESVAAGATRGGACDGVVCFAAVDWWYHNRGHSECQIMRRLARRVPVLWVNSIGMRAPMPGKTELPLRRYLRKLKSTFKGLRRDESGMWVYSPLFIPRYTLRAVELNGRLLALQIAVLRKRLGMKRPAAFVTLPTAAPAAERCVWSRMVFNRSDEFSAFREVDTALIKPLEERLLAAADNVIYVNRRLLERERTRVRDPRYIGHGVDFDAFCGAGLRPRDQNVPERLRHLPRPIIGFYGALDDYTIDLELLVKVARHVRPAPLVIIGPKAMDISRLEQEPNVTYLGPVAYADIPRYAAAFDVALMPWLQNDWIAGCNPIKLKEYLALGCPIVSIGFPELKAYEHLVYAADSHEQFLAGIDRALQESDVSLSARRRAAVAADSWDALADQVAQMLRLPGSAKT